MIVLKIVAVWFLVSLIVTPVIAKFVGFNRLGDDE